MNRLIVKVLLEPRLGVAQKGPRLSSGTYVFLIKWELLRSWSAFQAFCEGSFIVGEKWRSPVSTTPWRARMNSFRPERGCVAAALKHSWHCPGALEAQGCSYRIWHRCQRG